MTTPALVTTITFLVLDFVVAWLGELAAERFGFHGSLLIPATFLICVAAGFCARNRGAYGMMAGGLIPGVEALLWIGTGHLTPDLVPAGYLRLVVGWTLVLLGSVAGALAGALGDWLARRGSGASASGGGPPAVEHRPS